MILHLHLYCYYTHFFVHINYRLVIWRFFRQIIDLYFVFIIKITIDHSTFNTNEKDPRKQPQTFPDSFIYDYVLFRHQLSGTGADFPTKSPLNASSCIPDITSVLGVILHHKVFIDYQITGIASSPNKLISKL